jgi:hypothetical protein
MGMENERLRQLKLIQAANCKKTKPWNKSSGPRTAEGKQKATRNLPNQPNKTSKALRNLQKLQEALTKLRRREERSKKRQQSALGKLEKLAEKNHFQKSNG